jgi:ammonia channel protein AmtB
MNSALTGLVMISGVCENVDVYSSLVIGFLSGIMYLAAGIFLERFRIDDPIESI